MDRMVNRVQSGGRKPRIQRAVILLSGGMDSTTLLHYLRKTLGVREVHALSFRYGQKHVRELCAARWQARAAGVAEHCVLDMGFLAGVMANSSALTDPRRPVPDLRHLTTRQKAQPPTYVPNRNMILLALAAAYAEARGICDVFYGAQAQDEYGYWDCTGPFLHRLNTTLALNRRKAVRVHAPFLHLCKADELRIGRKLGVEYARTWSCYRGGRTPCGTCPACVERKRAFEKIGVADPLRAR